MAKIFKLTFGGEDEEEESQETQELWREHLFMLLVGVILGVLSTLTFLQF